MCKLNKKNDGRRLDPCMKKIIDHLKVFLSQGTVTIACCCGHGKYPMSIIIKNTMWEDRTCNFELFSGKYLNNKKRFYKKDKQGYYFIPEVLENEK